MGNHPVHADYLRLKIRHKYYRRVREQLRENLYANGYRDLLKDIGKILQGKINVHEDKVEVDAKLSISIAQLRRFFGGRENNLRRSFFDCCLQYVQPIFKENPDQEELSIQKVNDFISIQESRFHPKINADEIKDLRQKVWKKFETLKNRNQTKTLSDIWESIKLATDKLEDHVDFYLSHEPPDFLTAILIDDLTDFVSAEFFISELNTLYYYISDGTKDRERYRKKVAVNLMDFKTRLDILEEHVGNLIYIKEQISESRELKNSGTTEDMRISLERFSRLYAEIIKVQEERITGSIIQIKDNRYMIRKLLYSGYHSMIWTALKIEGQDFNEEVVAIKFLYAHYYQEGSVRRQFINGAKLQKEIVEEYKNNPFKKIKPRIVEVYGQPIEDDESQLAFFIMKYVDGGVSLRNWVLSKGKQQMTVSLQSPLMNEVERDPEYPVEESFLPGKISTPNYTREILRIYRDLNETVRCMHDVNCYHLDICPNNILISRTGDIFLTDFDNAQRRTININYSQIIEYGTPPYRDNIGLQAEELNSDDYRNHSRIGQQADLYSLAKMLLFCRLRQSLQTDEFRRKNDVSLIKASNSTQRLEKILLRGVRKEQPPYSRMEAFEQELQKVRSFAPLMNKNRLIRIVLVLTTLLSLLFVGTLIEHSYTSANHDKEEVKLLTVDSLIKDYRFNSLILNEAFIEHLKDLYDSKQLDSGELKVISRALILDESLEKYTPSDSIPAGKFNFFPGKVMLSPLPERRKNKAAIEKDSLLTLRLFGNFIQSLTAREYQKGDSPHQYQSLGIGNPALAKQDEFQIDLVYAVYEGPNTLDTCDNTLVMLRWPAYDIYNLGWDYTQYDPRERGWYKQKLDKYGAFKIKGTKLTQGCSSCELAVLSPYPTVRGKLGRSLLFRRTTEEGGTFTYVINFVYCEQANSLLNRLIYAF